MAEGSSQNDNIIPLLSAPESPPKSQIDDASIQKAMDKNKESLKVKLMLRRPINQLVEQGILPPLKTPPAFHEQRQKLERAKMGDFLKNKIQRRPDRQELIQQHILEDTTVDPSLQDKQRQLKKARLADDLNDRLSHRPGPLELIKGNILQTDEKFAQAVKEGQIQFKRTCEGQTQKHPPPRFIIEEDSGSEGALSPPQDLNDQSQTSIPSLELSEPSPVTSHGSPPPPDIKPIIALPSPQSLVSSILPIASSPSQGKESSSSSSSNKNRKKSKSKAQPKARTIKFHEYKGPPNAQKNQTASPQSETSYELLLQQQQLFLQWQLEWQQKYSPIILPAAQKPTGDQGQGSQQSQENSVQRSLSKLEDMKVSDLKAELKRRNLPVSGSKPQLIERLKPYSEMSEPLACIAAQALPVSIGGILLDTVQSTQMEAELSPVSPPLVTDMDTMALYKVVSSRPPSVVPMDVDNNSNNAVDAMDVSDSANPGGFIDVDIMKLQQKKIEELQRELQRYLQLSQLQLGLLQQQPVTSIQVPVSNTSPVETKMLQKQMLQQHLQQKIQHQQLVQQLQQQGVNTAHPSNTTSAAVKASLAAFLHSQQHAAVSQPAAVLPPNSPEQALILCQTSPPNSLEDKTQDSLPNGLGHQRTNSLPNFTALVTTKEAPSRTNTEPQFLITRPPPDYDEATKQMNKHQFAVGVLNHLTGRPSGQKSFKSQAVDDVLEILIKNGELPPSAAQEPPTPTTPETAKAGTEPPVFPPSADTPQPPDTLTPPPSTLLNDTATLDFDFHLDLDDIEAMDLGVLAGEETTLHKSGCPQSRHTGNQRSMQVNDYAGLHDAVDMELSDWLDVMIPTTAVTTGSTGNVGTLGYNSAHEHDPLLSNMANNHDPFDLFAVDDVDFKTSTDLSSLSWDKVDFAT